MMRLSPKISVIIPVYKAEQYLFRCVDSLSVQTFTDFEILLIDDGSPDKSGDICDDYAHKDLRVRAFHKSNGGVSSARQFGIEKALGEYIIHADPDDWVEPTMLGELYNTAIEKDADLVICDYYVNTKNKQTYIIQRPSSLEHHSIFKDLLHHLHGSCCNKLVRRSCYSNYDVKFPQKINYCEDLFTWFVLLQYPIKIAYLNQAFYHYDNYTNVNSISRNFTYEKYKERRLFYDTLKSTLSPEFSSQISPLLVNIIFEAFSQNVFTNSEFKKIFSQDSKLILKSDVRGLIKYLSYFSSIGFYRVSYVLYKFMLQLNKFIKQ